MTTLTLVWSETSRYIIQRKTFRKAHIHVENFQVENFQVETFKVENFQETETEQKGRI